MYFSYDNLFLAWMSASFYITETSAGKLHSSKVGEILCVFVSGIVEVTVPLG